jgi:large subunit ribosomal protein L7e
MALIFFSELTFHVSLAKLKPLDAYLAYGYVSNKSVNELVHRRAFATVAGQRRPLSENVVVEEALGDLGILCLNDLVHEIYNVGSNFDKVVQFLHIFKLAAPVGGFESKILDQHDEVEGKGGFLGEGMDDFLSKIL